MSDLCKACKIFNICHEPQKKMARSCQHFEGDIPNGYVEYLSLVVKLVYKRGFASNIAYLDLPSGRQWLEQWQVNNLIARAPQQEAS